MFAHSVYALFVFHACDFPAKSEKKPGYLLLTEGCMLHTHQDTLVGCTDPRVGILVLRPTAPVLVTPPSTSQMKVDSHNTPRSLPTGP